MGNLPALFLSCRTGTSHSYRRRCRRSTMPSRKIATRMPKTGTSCAPPEKEIPVGGSCVIGSTDGGSVCRAVTSAAPPAAVAVNGGVAVGASSVGVAPGGDTVAKAAGATASPVAGTAVTVLLATGVVESPGRIAL